MKRLGRRGDVERTHDVEGCGVGGGLVLEEEARDVGEFPFVPFVVAMEMMAALRFVTARYFVATFRSMAACLFWRWSCCGG